MLAGSSTDSRPPVLEEVSPFRLYFRRPKISRNASLTFLDVAVEAYASRPHIPDAGVFGVNQGRTPATFIWMRYKPVRAVT
jgi:hypothetical protein